MLEKKIYIVDDYPLAAFITKKTIQKLSTHPCNILEFENPALLLSRFKEEFETIDMLITDYEMPNMRGDSLIEEIRSLQPNIKIVVASAWLDTSLSEEQELVGRQVKALNPDLILTKPFPEGWVKTVDEILEQ